MFSLKQSHANQLVEPQSPDMCQKKLFGFNYVYELNILFNSYFNFIFQTSRCISYTSE